METRIVSRQEMHPVKSHVGVLREEYVTPWRLWSNLLMTKADSGFSKLIEASFSLSEDSQTPQLALIVASV